MKKLLTSFVVLALSACHTAPMLVESEEPKEQVEPEPSFVSRSHWEVAKAHSDKPTTKVDVPGQIDKARDLMSDEGVDYTKHGMTYENTDRVRSTYYTSKYNYHRPKAERLWKSALDAAERGALNVDIVKNNMEEACRHLSHIPLHPSAIGMTRSKAREAVRSHSLKMIAHYRQLLDVQMNDDLIRRRDFYKRMKEHPPLPSCLK